VALPFYGLSKGGEALHAWICPPEPKKKEAPGGVVGAHAAGELRHEAAEHLAPHGVGGAEAARRHPARMGLGAGGDHRAVPARRFHGRRDAAGGGAVDEDVDVLRLLGPESPGGGG
jgi:hypothetical protein